MKAVNIKWDVDSKEDLASLPSEIQIPDNVLADAHEPQMSTDELYQARIEAVSEYITSETGFCHEGFDIEIERKDAVQYALDNGTGIEYSPNKGETTQAEIDKAGDAARYVDKDTVDFWAQEQDTPAATNSRIEYAIISGMCLLDFDEWQATCEATGVDNMSYPDAAEISGILYENYDQTPLESPAVASRISEAVPLSDLKTVKAAFDVPEMSREHEQQIHEIMAKYGKPQLEISSEKELE